MSDDKPTIHERMVAILGELPAIGKEQFNPQQNFHFRGHDQILTALNPLLAKHGVFVVPIVQERVTDQRLTAKKAIMFEVNLRVLYRFYGASGDHVDVVTWGEGTDMGDKATNKAMTMAFKNALNQAFAISSEEFRDADGEAPEESVAQTGDDPPQGLAYPANWQEIGERFAKVLTEEDGREWVREAIETFYPGKNFAQLTVEERAEAGKMAAETLLALEDQFGGSFSFPPPTRDQVAKAFADNWAGTGLHGPPWRVSPDDPESLPSYDDWKLAQEAAAEPEPTPGE